MSLFLYLVRTKHQSSSEAFCVNIS